jgi:hypothetical protein
MKSKTVPLKAMKAYKGNSGIAALIINNKKCQMFYRACHDVIFQHKTWHPLFWDITLRYYLGNRFAMFQGKVQS